MTERISTGYVGELLAIDTENRDVAVCAANSGQLAADTANPVYG